MILSKLLNFSESLFSHLPIGIIISLRACCDAHVCAQQLIVTMITLDGDTNLSTINIKKHQGVLVDSSQHCNMTTKIIKSSCNPRMHYYDGKRI